MKISHRRGLPLSIKFTVTEAGEPIDLTGGTVELAIKEQAVAYGIDDRVKALSKLIEDIEDGEDGEVTFYLDSTDMTGKYFYDLYISTPLEDYATTLDEIRILPRGA